MQAKGPARDDHLSSDDIIIIEPFHVNASQRQRPANASLYRTTGSMTTESQTSNTSLGDSVPQTTPFSSSTSARRTTQSQQRKRRGANLGTSFTSDFQRVSEPTVPPQRSPDGTPRASSRNSARNLSTQTTNDQLTPRPSASASAPLKTLESIAHRASQSILPPELAGPNPSLPCPRPFGREAVVQALKERAAVQSISTKATSPSAARHSVEMMRQAEAIEGTHLGQPPQRTGLTRASTPPIAPSLLAKVPVVAPSSPSDIPICAPRSRHPRPSTSREIAPALVLQTKRRAPDTPPTGLTSPEIKRIIQNTNFELCDPSLQHSALFQVEWAQHGLPTFQQSRGIGQGFKKAEGPRVQQRCYQKPSWEADSRSVDVLKRKLVEKEHFVALLWARDLVGGEADAYGRDANVPTVRRDIVGGVDMYLIGQEFPLMTVQIMGYIVGIVEKDDKTTYRGKSLRVPPHGLTADRCAICSG